MTRVRYQISDEPSPSAMARLIVEPFWPLLACMLVGGIPGLAWLAFNGFALGSPTRTREWLMCLAGALGALGIFGLVVFGTSTGLISGPAARYWFLFVLVSKLSFAYMVYFLQQRSLELHEYYGGSKANGLVPLILASLLLRPAIAGLFARYPLLSVLFL